MALITCPQCGEQVSDKAKTCIHCGYDLSGLKGTGKKICPECGTELEEGAKVCPQCGYPIEEPEEESKEKSNQETTDEYKEKSHSEATEESKPQQVEVTGFRNGRKILIAVIAAVVVVGVGIIAGTQIKNQRDAKRAAQESADYKDNLSLITFLMLDGAADAEDAGNLIHSVWYNSIYEKSDSTTNQYTRSGSSSYAHYYDFNEALANLFSDTDFQSDISDIESNQSSVNSLMKELKDPPDEWSEAYSTLQDYYDAYITLTDLVLNPTGSLMTYTSNFNDADSELLSAYKKMNLYLE